MFAHKSGYFFGSAAKIWWQFVAAGLFALGSPLLTLQVPISQVILIGVVAILIGVTLKFNYFGLQIAGNKIRNYTAIYGFKTGAWYNLPQIQRIVLTHKNASLWNTPNGVSPTFKTNSTIYTIALFTEEQNPAYFIQTEDENIANKQTEKLSKMWNLEPEKL